MYIFFVFLFLIPVNSNKGQNVIFVVKETRKKYKHSNHMKVLSS